MPVERLFFPYESFPSRPPGLILGRLVEGTGLRATTMHYDFARIHETLRITSAMAAGIADHVWNLEEIIRATTWELGQLSHFT